MHPSKETQSSLSSAEDTFLETDADAGARLLVCSLYEDQRPLKGTAGALDWRLRGFLSRFLIQGHIHGSAQELVYIPVKHQDSMRHLLLVGLGSAKRPVTEQEPLLKRIAETAKNLNFKKIALSASSFPFDAIQNTTQLKRIFKEIDVELIA